MATSTHTLAASSTAQSTFVPSGYFAYPATVWGLPDELRTGLKAIGVVALASTLSTFSLLCFVTYRMIFWRGKYNSSPALNQNVLLVYNLLLGDFFQSISFLVSFHWVAVDGILAPTAACTTQALILHFGDVSSGTFVFLIGIHTAASVIFGRTPSHRLLIGSILTCWVFALVVTVLGPIIYGRTFYTATGAWCWENRNYEGARLWSHYVWIFIFEFGTLAIYITAFILVRKRLVMNRATTHNPYSHSGGSSHVSSPTFVRTGNVTARVNRATFYMIVYPITYVCCTAPLAIGRMYTMSTHADNPMWFYILAGCLLTSCGWIDAVLYTITRRVLVNSDSGRYRARGSPPRSRDAHDGGLKHGSAQVRTPGDAELQDPDNYYELYGVHHLGTNEKVIALPPTAFKTTITAGRIERDGRKTRTGSISSRGETDDDLVSRSGSTDQIFGQVRADTKVEVTVEERMRRQ